MVPIQQYGGTGDGVTNNTTALQAAVDALTAGGGTIYMPAGTYLCSTSIAWKSNVNLVGDGMGKTIIQLADGAQIEATGTPEAPISDCSFRDFTVDGSAHTDWYKGFFFIYCLRLTYTRVKVQNTGATGFGNDYMVDCLYDSCIADDCGTSGTIETAGCSGFGIGTGKYEKENTRLVNCTATGNKRYGAFFEKQESGVGNYFSQGCEISGGTFDSNQWGVGDCGVDGLIVDSATVTNNIAAGVYVGGPSLLNVAGINGTISNCEIAGNGAAGIEPAAPDTYTLTNNNVHDNGA